MVNPVNWFEIHVSDMERARTFYETVLDTELATIPPPDGGNGPTAPMLAFPMEMGAPGSAGALVQVEDVPGGGGAMVYFTCEDCGVAAARVAGAGGRLVSDKFSIGQYGHIAVAQDPDGNRFGLHSER